MKGRRQGARAPIGRISGCVVSWRFEESNDHEGRLVGTLEYQGLTFEGVADVIPRFLREATNPEILWQEHAQRVATNIRTGLWRLRQIGA